jgi:predicted nuclease of predicted toxin-antitoxin system
VTVLLDENFPLGWVRVLEADGVKVEHIIITLGWRGASDARIRERLNDNDLIFLTQDEDFLSGKAVPATVVVSRVRQSRTLTDRIQVWKSAVHALLAIRGATRVFALKDDGAVVPWSPTESEQ